MNAVAQLSLIIIFKKLRVEQMSRVPPAVRVPQVENHWSRSFGKSS